MVFFVECGNNFTLSYGDIDDDFYDSLLLMYEKAIQNVTELSPEEQKVLQINNIQFLIYSNRFSLFYRINF